MLMPWPGLAPEPGIMDNENCHRTPYYYGMKQLGLPVLVRFMIPQSMLSRCRGQKRKTAAGETGFYGLQNRYLLTETK